MSSLPFLNLSMYVFPERRRRAARRTDRLCKRCRRHLSGPSGTGRRRQRPESSVSAKQLVCITLQVECARLPPSDINTYNIHTYHSKGPATEAGQSFSGAAAASRRGFPTDNGTCRTESVPGPCPLRCCPWPQNAGGAACPPTNSMHELRRLQLQHTRRNGGTHDRGVFTSTLTPLPLVVSSLRASWHVKPGILFAVQARS